MKRIRLITNGRGNRELAWVVERADWRGRVLAREVVFEWDHLDAALARVGKTKRWRQGRG